MNSDVYLSSRVYSSAQLIYGYGANKSSFRRNSLKALAEEIEFALDQLSLLLTFDRKVRVRLARFKKPSITGQYCHHNKEVTLKPSNIRHMCDRMVSTLSHELVHAEQYYQKRLKSDHKRFYWVGDSGTKSIPGYQSSNYLKYRSFPWEVEAFSRQEELKNIVMPFIEEKFYAQNQNT
jgi:hypothetical protein